MAGQSAEACCKMVADPSIVMIIADACSSSAAPAVPDPAGS